MLIRRGPIYCLCVKFLNRKYLDLWCVISMAIIAITIIDIMHLHTKVGAIRQPLIVLSAAQYSQLI